MISVINSAINRSKSLLKFTQLIEIIDNNACKDGVEVNEKVSAKFNIEFNDLSTLRTASALNLLMEESRLWTRTRLLKN